MSTSWTIHCQTCGQDMKHPYEEPRFSRPEELQDLVNNCREVAQISLLAQKLQSSVVVLETGLLEGRVFPGWFNDHFNHYLVVRSEYGERFGHCSEPLPCPTCGVRQGRCELAPGHEGPHGVRGHR